MKKNIRIFRDIADNIKKKIFVKENDEKVGNINEQLSEVILNDNFNNEYFLQTLSSNKSNNTNKINVIPNNINDEPLINEANERHEEINKFDELFGDAISNNEEEQDIFRNEIENDNFNNEDPLQKLSLNNLKNNKSYNTLSKTGIKNKISKWKEDIKNSILEDIIHTDKTKRKIPDKNTAKTYVETDDFYIVDGIFIIKEGKKWLNQEMPGVEMSQHWDNTHKRNTKIDEESYMLSFQNNQHMYYFENLDDIQNEKSYVERYGEMMEEREKQEIESELFNRAIENKQYMNYLEDIVEINDSNLLEEKLQEKMLEKINP